MTNTITLTLPDDLAERLAALPAEDVNKLMAAVNAYAVAALSELVADPDAGLTEEERADVRDGLARSLADSAAGRVKPADQVYARLAAEQGVTW